MLGGVPPQAPKPAIPAPPGTAAALHVGVGVASTASPARAAIANGVARARMLGGTGAPAGTTPGAPAPAPAPLPKILPSSPPPLPQPAIRPATREAANAIRALETLAFFSIGPPFRFAG